MKIETSRGMWQWGLYFNIYNTGGLLLVLKWDFFSFSFCLLTLFLFVFLGFFFSTITYPLWQLYASHHTLALEILPYFSPERKFLVNIGLELLNQ